MKKMKQSVRAGILCGILLLLAICAGCGSRTYEKIEVSAEKEPVIEIQLASEKSIVIEQGAEDREAGKDRLNGPGEWKGKETLSESDEVGTGETEAKETELKEEEYQETTNQAVTLLFSGDILLSDHVLAAYQKAGGINGVLDQQYLREIKDADVFFANEEFPFSNRGTQAPDKQFTFRLPPEKVDIFREIGVDGVTLANNHALDYGTEALLDTCAVLDQAGIPHTGAGADLTKASEEVIYEIHGVRIAVIGATRVIPVANWAAAGGHPGMLAAYDPAVLLKRIRDLKTENDLVIACIHWGIERAEMPNDVQKSLGKQMIDAGADLVVGSHPHVLQGIEYYKDKPIVYSLGNFIFGSSIPRTALLKVQYDGTQEAAERMKLSLLPGTSGAGYTHTLDSEAKKQEFFQYMKSISFGVSYDEDGTVTRD